MRKFLLPFLLPVAGFVAVKGYYWFQVKSAADEWVQAMSPFAAVEYEGIVAQFDGVAGVTGLRILPHGAGVPMEIRAVTAAASSWTEFLQIRDQSDLPHRLSVSVQGVRVEADSPFFNRFTANSNQALLGCTKAPGLGSLMAELGYQSLETDLELAYAFNPASEFLTLEVEAATDQNFRLQARTDIDLGVTELSRSTLLGTSPRFGGLQLTYWDDSFFERRNRYCAKLNGEEISAFVDRHLALTVEQYQASGFAFGAPLVAAYREFVAEGGDFSITLHAPEPLGAEKLLLSSPRDLLQAMDVSIAVNGEPVQPLELVWSPPQQRTQTLPETLAGGVNAGPAQVQETVLEPEVVLEADQAPLNAEAAAEPLEAVAVQETEPARQPAFRPVAVEAIEGHLGQRVRVLTHNGREIEGVLVSRGRNGLRLRQQLEMGEAELPITFARIGSIEAFY